MISYRAAAQRALAYVLLSGMVCLTPGRGQAPDPSGRIVRFDANIIQVDAVVTDAQGGYLRDLNADDFRILQDGKPRKITSFSYVPGAAEPRVPRTIVFLIDDGNMPPLNLARVRDALSRFCEEGLQQEDKVALVNTMGGSGFLHQFLPPGKQLQAAIEDLHSRPEVSASFAINRTIELLRRTIVSLAELPGRKALIVLSNDMLGERFDLRSIADSASRASVVVHAVNPRPAKFEDPGDTFLPGLAAVTGGLVRPGGLDLYANVKAVVDDQAGYYLIGWDPGSALKQLWSWPVYHRLSVKAIRTGATVRSRDGFFGVTGPLALGSSSSQMQHILAAMYLPVRTQHIPVRITPVQRQRENESYIQSLVYIGGGIELTGDTDDCYRASLTIYSSIVRANSPDDPALATRGAKLRVCGKQALSVREKGLVAVIEDRIPGAGLYRVHVGVRNGTSGADAQAGRPTGLIRRADWKLEAAQMGTANEFIDIGEGALPPLLLRGANAVPTAAGAPLQLQFRTLAVNDPAIRDFRSGDILVYDTVPRAAFEITRDGELVDSGEATGRYRLKSSMAPGQYLLKEKAVDGAGVFLWSDFRIVKN